MTPARAGAGLIPAAISGVVGTLLGGIILKRIGKFYWLALVASSVGALAAVPIAVAPSLGQGSFVTICIASVASFVPQGITVTASLIAISKFLTKDLRQTVADIFLVSNVSAADQAVATACSFLFRSLGAAVGVYLVGLVIQQVLGVKLRASLDPHEADQILDKIARSLDAIKDLRPELQTVVRECYGDGIQSGFVMCVALLVTAALSVIWWREKKMAG